MENLQNSIKKLNGHELKLFRRKLKGNPQKIKMVNYIASNDELNENELFQLLGYKHDQKSSFYTLKHRLLSDLKEFNMSKNNNEISLIHQRIANLRNLLYSREIDLFLKEVKFLKKKSEEYELFKNQYEIVFCEYLFHYQQPQNKKSIEKELKEIIEKERIYKSAEAEFYRIIFSFQDYFFDPGHEIVNMSEEICLLENYHQLLQSKVTEFFLLSAELTLTLNVNADLNLNNDCSTKILRLHKLYQIAPIYYSFPDCDFAIECLFNKYYFLTNDHENFQKSMLRLDHRQNRIDGIRVYGGANNYYLFAKANHYLKSGQNQELENFLIQLGNTKEDKLYGDQTYITYYLWLLLNLSKGNLKKAEYYALKCRNISHQHKHQLYWLYFEVEFLILLFNLKSKSSSLANSGTKSMIKILSSSQIKDQFKPILKEIVKYHNFPGKQLWIDILSDCIDLQKNFRIFNNVNFLLFQ